MSVLIYTVQRLVLLIAVGGLAYSAGLRGVLLITVAFLVSGVMSVFVLRGTRSQAGASVSGFFTRINAKIDAAAGAEDHLTADPAEAPRTAAESAVHATNEHAVLPVGVDETATGRT